MRLWLDVFPGSQLHEWRHCAHSGGLPAGGAGRAGSAPGPLGHILPEQQKAVLRSEILGKKALLPDFSVLNSGEGKGAALSCLWGQLCWRAHIDATPDLFLDGSNDRTHSIPWLQQGLPWREPGSAAAHRHQDKGVAAFRGRMTFQRPAPAHAWVGSGAAHRGQDQLVLIKINHKQR